MIKLNITNISSQLNMEVFRSKNVNISFFWLGSLLAFVLVATSVNYPAAFYNSSITLCILSILALVVRSDRQALSKLEKVMVLTWLSYPTLAALDFWFRTGWNWPEFQEPSRFLLVIPIFLMVRHFGVSKNALKWGFFFGALVAGLWALYQNQIIGLDRAFGGTSALRHAFGNVSLLLGFMTLALFQPKWSKDWRWGFVVLIPFSLGMFASLASGAKGGWVSLPILCWLAVDLARHPTFAKRLSLMAVMSIVIVLVWYFSLFVQIRVGNIPVEIIRYFETGDITGSASHRLALWHSASLIFIDNPFFGSGIDSFTAARAPYIESGLVTKIFNGDVGTHSQFFNALHEMGLIGVISVFSIYGVFIIYCYQFITKNKELAVAGLFLAAGFINFGFVEVIWGINNAGVFFTVVMVLIAGQLSYEYKLTATQATE